jgi:hypothetical protein
MQAGPSSESCSRIALCLIARSARCDVRSVAAISSSDRRREHREFAAISSLAEET